MSDYLIDDRFIISDRVDNMTDEELDKELERLKQKNKQKKLALQQQDTSKKIAV